MEEPITQTMSLDNICPKCKTDKLYAYWHTPAGVFPELGRWYVECDSVNCNYELEGSFSSPDEVTKNVKNRIMEETKEMTHEEKINYMKIATGIVGYGFDNKGLDMLVSLYELVIKIQDKTDLEMIIKVQADVDKRNTIDNKQE